MIDARTRMTQSSIVVSLLTEDQDFQRAQAADATAAASHHAFHAEILFARNNARLQGEQLYKFIHGFHVVRPSAIVIQTVAGDGLPKVARDATAAGIGWVLLNRQVDYIEPLRAEHRALPIGTVTTDQHGIGRIQGTQVRTLLPGGGTVLYIQGPPDTSASKERLQGLTETVAGSNISLQILDGEWTEASGEKATASWLRLHASAGPPPDLVVAQSDAMAAGARKAIAAVRPAWLDRPFLGCDGLPDGGQRLVREGVLAATIIVPTTTGPAIQFVAQHLRTGASANGRVVLSAKPFGR